MSDYRLTRTQKLVVKAIYAARVASGSKRVTNDEVSKHTELVLIAEGDPKPKKVSRQNWTSKSKYTKTDQVWRLISEAIKGNLPGNHPIERMIRDCDIPDQALLRSLKEENIALKSETKDLLRCVDDVNNQKKEIEKKFKELRSKHYTKQGEDALYKVSFERIVRENRGLAKQADTDSKTIKGLMMKISECQKEINTLKASLSDLNISHKKVSPIIKPKLFEPRISGKDPDKSSDALLKDYYDESYSLLDSLENIIKSIQDSEIVLIFQMFNCNVKSLIAQGKIPFRSAKKNTYVFSFLGIYKDFRKEVYKRLLPFSFAEPQVVIIVNSKIATLPTERTNHNNQQWLEHLVHTEKFRKQTINPETEGYESVIYRKLSDV